MHSASAILAVTQFESGPKIVNSFLNDIYFTRCPLHQLLLERLESTRSCHQRIYDHRTAQSYTYAELAQLIRRTATAFAQQFTVPGDYVLMIGTNCVEYLALHFGAQCVGAIPVTLPRQMITLQHIKTQIIQHNIQLIVVSGAEFDTDWIAKLLNSISSITQVIVYDHESIRANPFTDISRCEMKAEKNASSPTASHKIISFFEFIENANIAAIADDDLYRPKNVASAACCAACSAGNSEWPPNIYLYGHYSIVAAIEVLRHSSVLDYRSIDRLLVYGEFDHIENLLMFLSGIIFGCTIILHPTYEHTAILQSLTRHRINLAWFSSSTVHRLLKTITDHRKTSSSSAAAAAAEASAALESVIKIITFGGKISDQCCRKFLQHFPKVKSLRHCYMIAETPIPIAMMIRNSHDYDSVGFVMPNSRLKIVADPRDPDQSANESTKPGFIAVERDADLFALGYLSPCGGQQTQSLPFERILRENDDSTRIVSAKSIIIEKRSSSSSTNSSSSRRWLRTDDIGYFDDDGLIYVHGKWYHSTPPITGIRARIQENEIESLLRAHPAIDQIALTLKLDYTWAVTVIPRNVATTQIPQFLREISAYLNEKMPQHSVLVNPMATVANIFVKRSFPKTSNGRTIRALIRTEVQNLLNIKRKF